MLSPICDRAPFSPPPQICRRRPGEGGVEATSGEPRGGGLGLLRPLRRSGKRGRVEGGQRGLKWRLKATTTTKKINRSHPVGNVCKQREGKKKKRIAMRRIIYSWQFTQSAVSTRGEGTAPTVAERRAKPSFQQFVQALVFTLPKAVAKEEE